MGKGANSAASKPALAAMAIASARPPSARRAQSAGSARSAQNGAAAAADCSASQRTATRKRLGVVMANKGRPLLARAAPVRRAMVSPRGANSQTRPSGSAASRW